MKHECGQCTFCCWMFGNDEVGKTHHAHCKHECATGCHIHESEDYPNQCRKFQCPYLAGADIYRPDTFQPILKLLGGNLGGFVPYIDSRVPLSTALNAIVKHRVMPAAFQTDGGWLAAVVPIDQTEKDSITFTTEHKRIWDKEIQSDETINGATLL